MCPDIFNTTTRAGSASTATEWASQRRAGPGGDDDASVPADGAAGVDQLIPQFEDRFGGPAGHRDRVRPSRKSRGRHAVSP